LLFRVMPFHDVDFLPFVYASKWPTDVSVSKNFPSQASQTEVSKPNSNKIVIFNKL